MKLVYCLLLTLSGVVAFSTPCPWNHRNGVIRATCSRLAKSLQVYSTTTPVDQVVVLKDAKAVGTRVKEIVEQAAQAAIADKGHFWLAIPGGSILKMLVGSKGDWTSKTSIAYVNHKCVPMDNMELATHAKAMNLFMSEWEGCQPITLDGTDDGEAEAISYQANLQSMPQVDTEFGSIPVFDLALIGVGDDGHVGSLYPNREEVLEKQKWVVPVMMKSPPSITLTLPVMVHAKQVVVAACGVSDKYPQGKSEGMKRAIVQDETLQSFPAVGLRERATWIMDEAAASKLGDAYNQR